MFAIIFKLQAAFGVEHENRSKFTGRTTTTGQFW